MKLYSLDNNPDYESLSNNPYIGEIEESAATYEIIRTIKGDFVIGVLDEKNDCAGAHEIKELNLEIGKEEIYKHNITCPCCGYEDRDSWECEDSNDEYECGQCGATIEYERIVTVEYSSELVKLPSIINAELKDKEVREN
ncbi:hypothetical protein [Anaerovorax odorimutans]|uniref:hypothetical protein n=1 Tax=Anaerovorax odorimutans TaxID=109327 RepID=UPI00040401AC|nr:hypothetical protein [Anaerovorax odorimutans]